ncbi:type II toxin-antitoxin system VapC family toxin [Sphingorhabdus sp. 109]|uniref:type II toxin-antitoxin system VapC family toxin n=1 Tax=Sphingorhabdus sp. 109 TaxID=2653173 RepID=UPI0012EF0C2A|nr:type II toxin-antitoxin system VapC family toxin [Sphingorhabdus sp. 109]VWX61481.1 PilT protein domain protein [Sphingorhabdus sp. 109]
MDLLIDTHVLAWIGDDDPRLSHNFLAELPNVDNRLFVSAVTAYEYSDLLGRGRFPASVPLSRFQRKLGFHLLDFPADLWEIATELPDIHRDPVDRMLIAHAIVLGLTLVTADKNIHHYPVKTLW